MKKSYPKLYSIKWKNGAHAENILFHPDRTRADIPARDVLIGALEADLKSVVVMGYCQDGSEYIAGSTHRHEDAAYMFGRGYYFVLGLKDQ